MAKIFSQFFIAIFFLQLFPTRIISKEFPKNIFSSRRDTLMNRMKEGIAVLESGKTYLRNGDVNYDFRQNSDFYYLTGFEEPGSTLVLLPGNENKFVLFVREVNPYSEIMGNKRSGIKGAIKVFGADTAYPVSMFDKMLPQLLKNVKQIFINSTEKDLKKKIESAWEIANKNSEPSIQKEYLKLNKLIGEMRLKKDNNEIELIQRACGITSEGYSEVLKTAEPGMYEYEYEAILDYVFKKNDAERHAFPPIIGSGKNALILHYDENSRKTENGDLVVMDIGAEYKYYAADITRTFPVNGKFSDEQKEIYEIVLRAQKKGIEEARKGIGFNELQEKVTEVIGTGLFDLGLITDKSSKWQITIWMPHGVSHMLGLDVHDVGDVGMFEKKGRLLEPGMIFTIEPGIYINENIFDTLHELFEDIDGSELEKFIAAVKPAVEKYKNIGIRIEDDILITENDNEVLSSSAPKEIHEIERLMSLKSKFN